MENKRPDASPEAAALQQIAQAPRPGIFQRVATGLGEAGVMAAVVAGLTAGYRLIKRQPGGVNWRTLLNGYDAAAITGAATVGGLTAPDLHLSRAQAGAALQVGQHVVADRDRLAAENVALREAAGIAGSTQDDALATQAPANDPASAGTQASTASTASTAATVAAAAPEALAAAETATVQPTPPLTQTPPPTPQPGAAEPGHRDVGAAAAEPAIDAVKQPGQPLASDAAVVDAAAETPAHSQQHTHHHGQHEHSQHAAHGGHAAKHAPAARPEGRAASFADREAGKGHQDIALGA